LVELLTVIAIIGLLAAILIPSAASVRISARRAKTKVQFSQLASAMEQFRQEYGYYPAIDGGSGGKVEPAVFAGALTGRALDGSAITLAAQLAGNSKRIAFYTPAEGELNEARTALVDAFGNADIAVLYDQNGDGWITGADGAFPAVAGTGGNVALLPDSQDLNPATGIRAGVLFYSAGRGVSPGDLVLSWK
jgi:type II secretory pathway pseudopilin PulG